MLIQIATLMLSLMLLVMLHELGHYVTARWFGVRVERFFCFFDYHFYTDILPYNISGPV